MQWDQGEGLNIAGLDPGPEKSAIVVINDDGLPIDIRILKNDVMSDFLRELPGSRIAIEMIASYGMPVGAEVFETCVWIGRFVEISIRHFHSCTRIKRKEVVNHLCGSAKGADANVRQALIDRFEAITPVRDTGKRSRAIGNKKNPGPLYEIHDDLWAALAVACTEFDRRRNFMR